MTMLTIQARDPLVVRDGRPNDGRSESRTLEFPLPSVIVGAVRTALGRRGGTFDASLIPSLLAQVHLRGPLLVAGGQWMAPAPHDALVLAVGDGAFRIRALRPMALPEGARTSLVGDLSLVGLPREEHDPLKPLRGAPRYWSWPAFERWLQDPRTYQAEEAAAILEGGVRGLVREERIHVAVGPNGTAEEGKLFGTEGIRSFAEPFRAAATEEGLEDHAQAADAAEVYYGVDVQVGDATLGSPPDGVRPLGGERRLVRWGKLDQLALPLLPDWLRQHVASTEPALVRVVLLTPAFVASSCRPACLERDGVASVVAAKVDRPQTISGWDMSRNLPHGQPKKTRRLAPCGSVFWVELSGTPEQRTRWLEEVWMRNVGDDEQLRRDGFGLAVVGIGRRA